MSGWNTADKMMDEDTGSDFPSVNNITVAGYLPHDTVAAPGKFPFLLTTFYSEVSFRGWSPLQVNPSLQKVLSLHAIRDQLLRISQVYKPRDG